MDRIALLASCSIYGKGDCVFVSSLCRNRAVSIAASESNLKQLMMIRDLIKDVSYLSANNGCKENVFTESCVYCKHRYLKITGHSSRAICGG